MLLSDFMKLNVKPKEILTTHSNFDTITGGLARGEFHLIAGATKNGKSMAILHLAVNCIKNGYKVEYLSLENDIEDDYERLKDALELYQVDESQYDLMNIEHLKGKIINQKQVAIETSIARGIDFVFIDGTEFVTRGSTGGEIHENGQKLAEGVLQAISKNQHKPCVVLSWQYNKQGSSKQIDKISQEDLSGSNSVVTMAYTTWLIKRELIGGKDNEDPKVEWRIRNLYSRRRLVNDFKTTFSVYDGSKFSLCIGMDEYNDYKEDYDCIEDLRNFI